MRIGDVIPQFIALDLDGTLLGTDGRVLPHTSGVLEAAHRTGMLVVVATGRPMGRAKEVTDNLLFVTHTVAANGSVIFDREGNTEYFALPRSVTDKVVEVVRTAYPEAGFQLITEVEAGSEPGLDAFVKVPGTDTVADVASVRGEQTVKLSVFHPSFGATDLLKLLPPLLPPGVEVIHSGLDFVEVVPPGLSKAFGLQVLRDRYGIDGTGTIAFGDGPNDREMLAWASVGVAMENADDETKRFADRVTASCDHDGIALVIEPLLKRINGSRPREALPHVLVPGHVEARGPARHHRRD